MELTEIWAEELPSDCPPDDSIQPAAIVYYRLARSNPPKEADFLSYRAKQPTKVLHFMDECLARALSVWDNIEDCKKVSKLPAHKKKPILIMQLLLTPIDGLVKQSGNVKSHYSWWRTKEHMIEKISIVEI